MELVATSNSARLIERRPAQEDRDWIRILAGRSVTKEANYPGTVRIAETTRRYLPAGSRVLDGGCGLGDKVLAFGRAGLEGYGVDTAGGIIELAKAQVPGLRVFTADVRTLPFPDGFFDGHWSLGVVEHFYDGFDDILSEIKRTLRPGGYLFLSVPTLNMLKRRRLSRAEYPVSHGREGFWQYYFSDDEIVALIADAGFTLKEKQRQGAYYGIKNDVEWLRPLMINTPLIIRACNVLFNRWLFHTSVFIFQRA